MVAKKSTKSESAAPADAKATKATPAVAEKPKKKKEAAATAADAAKNTVTAAAPLASKEPVAAAAGGEAVVDETNSKFRAALIDYNAKLQQVTAQTNSLKNDFKALEKMFTKEMKVLQRNGRRKKQTTRSPSGFVKPTLISDELATFLKKDKGVQMARTDVTREINAYIREHSLQDKVNGRKINADPKLTKLLNLTGEDELTYFNLQRYMSPHFHKENKEAATNTVTVAS